MQQRDTVRDDIVDFVYYFWTMILSVRLLGLMSPPGSSSSTENNVEPVKSLSGTVWLLGPVGDYISFAISYI